VHHLFSRDLSIIHNPHLEMVFLEDSSDKLFFPPLTRQHTEEREEAKEERGHKK